jgi:hypothetical protein
MLFALRIKKSAWNFFVALKKSHELEVQLEGHGTTVVYK